MMNLGCQVALDSDPVSFGTGLRRGLSVKRMIEFGSNHRAYRPIDQLAVDKIVPADKSALEARLRAASEVLDVTAFQQEKLRELGLTTIGDVLSAGEDVFRRAHYVGKVRARQMQNAAVAAVLEYLSG